MPEYAASLLNNYEDYTRFLGGVAAFEREAQLPAPVCYALDLALEELITNCIKYGYDDRAAHEIKVSLRYADAELTVQIEDDGHPFDPTGAQEPDLSLPLEQRQIGGLGLAMVRRNFPVFIYRRTENRNHLTLKLKG